MKDFNPTTSNVTANLIAGEKISNNVYRFKAVVSSLKNGWADAVSNLLGEDLKLVEQACFESDDIRQGGIGKVVEAFAVYAPTTMMVEKAELSSTLAELNVKKVSANLYMSDDESVWKVEQAGDQFIITKQGTDDIEALLANANLNPYSSKITFNDIVNKDGFGVVAFVHDNGCIEAGIAVGRANGDRERMQVILSDELSSKGKTAQPIVISSLQVVAFEEFEGIDEPEDFESFDPLDYYRQQYADDPEMIRTLETFAQGMNLQV